jgi:hypothetical protein
LIHKTTPRGCAAEKQNQLSENQFIGSPNAAALTNGGHRSTTGLVVPGGLGLTVIVLVAEAQNATVGG